MRKLWRVEKRSQRKAVAMEVLARMEAAAFPFLAGLK